MLPHTHLTCLCGAVEESSSLLQSDSFPIEAETCQCDTCRQVTGSVCPNGWVPLRSGPGEKSFQALRGYDSSRQSTRYFCATCGCHCFISTHHDGGKDTWSASCGIIENPDDLKSGCWVDVDNVIKLTGHEWVGDTRDGGLAASLGKLDGREIPCYGEDGRGRSKNVDATTMSKAMEPAVKDRSEDERLHASCKCGGVQLSIARPAWQESRWKLLPKDKTKWQARCCVCRSCRLALGFSLMPWAYVQPEKVFTMKGERVEFWEPTNDNWKSNLPNLKAYHSGPDCLRSFCGTCGATVFYEHRERPEIVDVATGILRSPTGAMARDWLEWEIQLVSWEEEAMDRDVLLALQS